MPEITATLNARLSSLLAELDAAEDLIAAAHDAGLDDEADRILDRIQDLHYEIEAAGTDVIAAEEFARGAYTTCGHEDYPCCGCDQ